MYEGEGAAREGMERRGRNVESMLTDIRILGVTSGRKRLRRVSRARLTYITPFLTS